MFNESYIYIYWYVLSMPTLIYTLKAAHGTANQNSFLTETDHSLTVSFTAYKVGYLDLCIISFSL
jgi:hypothetical protein